MLRVLAIVDSNVVRFLHAHLIGVLRGCEDVCVTTVAPSVPPYERTWVERLACALFAKGTLKRVALDGVRTVTDVVPDELPEADLIVDLREVASMQRPLTAKYGTWFLYKGPLRELPFFEDIRSGKRTVELELRSRDCDGRVLTLRSGRFPLSYSYCRTLHSACATIAAWLRADVAALVERPGARPRGRVVRRVAEVRSVALHELPLFAWRLAGMFARFAWEYFFTETSWNVGIARVGPSDAVDAGYVPAIRWLRTGRRRPFYADPFYLREGGREYVLCETVAEGSHDGKIEALGFARDGRILSRRTLIATGSHLSYPFVLEHGGRRYCIPESNAARRIEAYAEGADGSWTPAKTLLDDIDACDSTIFEHGGRWWLFCTRRSTGSNLNLHAYFAGDPLGTWMPHKANPIKSDIGSARPAGAVFAHGGSLYRPAQDCARGYGGSVVLHRILRLDEFEFEEEAVRTFSPDASYPHGLHTLNFGADDLVLVDGKRTRFSLRQAFRQATHLIRRHRERRRTASVRDAVPPNRWRQFHLAFPANWDEKRAYVLPASGPPGRLGPYYIRWSASTGVMGEDWDVCPFDRDGVLMTLRGGFYHPIEIAQYALHQHALYAETGSPQALQHFLAQARWLRDGQRERGAIAGCYAFAFPWERYGAPAGWISAMAQGEAISVLLRAEEIAPGEGFGAAARRAAAPFRHEIREGGVVWRNAGGDTFFEECSVEPPAHILNGHIFALWGIWELSRYDADAWLHELVDAGTATVRRRLPLYDTGYWSRYSLLETPRGGRHLATLKYHAFHISQLRVLAGMAGDASFDAAADRWQAYAERTGHRTRVMLATAASLVDRFVTHGDTVPGGARSIV